MDVQRFDSLTRTLAGGMERRNALKTLAGLVLAGFATRVVIQEAAACLQDGQGVCHSKADCCAGLGCFKQLGFECAPCKAHNKLCKDSDECCGDLTCNSRSHCTKGQGGGKEKDKDKKGNGKGKDHDTGGCSLTGEC